VTTRAYDSPLRAEQTERTRDAILAAFAEQLSEARDEFSIPRVAKRAGVSTRTVYHHFPNREAQVEALAAWIEKRIGVVTDGPKDLHDLAGFQARMCQRFAENEALVRAQLSAGIASSVRARRRKSRDAQYDKAIAPYVPNEREAKAISALMKHIVSGHAAVAVMDPYGVTLEETSKVFPWAVRVLAEAIERGDLPFGERKA
jgi:AcrR family transcriptional regulator